MGARLARNAPARRFECLAHQICKRGVTLLRCLLEFRSCRGKPSPIVSEPLSFGGQHALDLRRLRTAERLRCWTIFSAVSARRNCVSLKGSSVSKNMVELAGRLRVNPFAPPHREAVQA